MTDDNPPRLCVPQALFLTIFKWLHGQHSHLKPPRLSQITRQFFAPSIIKNFKRYLDRCLQYAILNKPKHIPLSSLQSIIPSPIPNLTITMDFALGPPDVDNCILPKDVLLIPGKSICTTAQWAVVIVDKLLFATWGIPLQILSDCDPKFLSALWKEFWT